MRKGAVFSQSALAQFPTELAAGIPLNLYENPEVDESIEQANQNIQLKQRIKSLAVQLLQDWRRRRRDKSEASLQHDAALIQVSEDERRRKEKLWVLSLDRGLHACSVERAGPHSIPTVLLVDALLEILAVDGAGPGVDPTDFAPLLARIIVNECVPPASTYTMEDLQWMYNINQDVGELSADDAKEIARVVSKARIEGARVGDTQLQLRVNRMYQKKREEREAQLNEALERARVAEAKVGLVDEEKKSLQDKLIRHRTKEIVGIERRKLLKQLIWRIPVAVLGFLGLWKVTTWLTQDLPIRAAVVTGLNVVAFLGILWKLISKPIHAYRAEVKTAKKRAEDEILKTSDRAN